MYLWQIYKYFTFATSDVFFELWQLNDYTNCNYLVVQTSEVIFYLDDEKNLT